MEREKLNYLDWSDFDSPDVKGSGKRFMETEPVAILETMIYMNRNMSVNIIRAFLSKTEADKLHLPTNDSHRLGKAITLRVVGKKKRLKVIKSLIELGITRIKVSETEVYFDTDEFKDDMFVLY